MRVPCPAQPQGLARFGSSGDDAERSETGEAIHVQAGLIEASCVTAADGRHK